MASKIKSVKDLRKLPSGNFLDTKTRVVWGKAIIEAEFAEELKNIADFAKPKAVVKTKVKTKAKK